MKNDPVKLSIRHDLAFLEALLRFANDQAETNSNPDESAPSPDQERQANQSMMVLCDMIDIFVDKQVEQKCRDFSTPRT